MALVNFPSGIPTLSAPMELEITPRVRTTQFGDGYSSVASDGINTMILKQQELAWNDLTETQFNALRQLFITCAGVHHFVYTLPYESTSRKLRPTKWTQSYDRVTRSMRVTVDEIP